MSRIRLIARHHFLIEARKRSFWILLFSLPLFLGFSVGLGILGERLSRGTAVIGYVDPAGFLVDTTLDSDEAELRRFDSAEAAQSALDGDDITAYYLLAEDFATGREAELVYYEAPSWQAQVAFAQMIRRNHLIGALPAVAERALAGVEVTVQALDTGREIGANPTVADFLPLLLALMIGFLAMTTSGYMMEVLVAEKENRTMEIVISSVSTAKLMTGKIIGALGIAGVQLLVWLVCIVAAMIIGRAGGVSWLLDVQPRWNDLAQIVVVALPVYFFLTAFFTTIGATLVESTEAQQVGPFLLLVLLLPVYIMPTLVETPNSPLALVISFFPPTAITAFALRMLLTPIPWWQVLTSAAISLAAAGAMTWVAAKAFRLGMLRYGQRLRFSEIFRPGRSQTGRGESVRQPAVQQAD